MMNRRSLLLGTLAAPFVRLPVASAASQVVEPVRFIDVFGPAPTLGSVWEIAAPLIVGTIVITPCIDGKPISRPVTLSAGQPCATFRYDPGSP